MRPLAWCGNGIGVYLEALARLQTHGYSFGDPKVRLLASPTHTPLAYRIATTLSQVNVVHEPLTQAYYHGLRFVIHVRTLAGAELPLVDGAAFDWLQQLGSNHKLVFVASGMGSQLIVQLFRSGSNDAATR